jgi:uncharacterized protein (TIGR00255 family)
VYVDPSAFTKIARELRNAADQAGVDSGVSISDVLQVYASHAEDVVEPVEQDEHFEAAMQDALADLAASRQQEGDRLRATMCSLLDQVSTEVEAIDELSASFAAEYHKRLEGRVREALSRFDAQEIDQRSILQEVALYADRCDVAEEIQRARSHVEKLREMFVGDSDEPVGKQIDFYLQELMREANTTGSKTAMVAVTDHVITVKAAVEKMREQAANIE